jgi:hypothetical protein
MASAFGRLFPWAGSRTPKDKELPPGNQGAVQRTLGPTTAGGHSCYYFFCVSNILFSFGQSGKNNADGKSFPWHLHSHG